MNRKRVGKEKEGGGGSAQRVARGVPEEGGRGGPGDEQSDRRVEAAGRLEGSPSLSPSPALLSHSHFAPVNGER